MAVVFPGRLRIALVDPDALQRACTASSLQAIGLSLVVFDHVDALEAALNGGLRFDLVLAGLHAGGGRMVGRLHDIPLVARGVLPLKYLAHRSELDFVRPYLRSGWIGDRHPDLLLSPLGDQALADALRELVPDATRWMPLARQVGEAA